MTRRFHAVGTGQTRSVWYIDHLWQHAAALTPLNLPLDTLDVLDQDAWFNHQPATLRGVVEHSRRIQASDLSFPIILGVDGRVMDGLHRIAHALMLGHATIPAVRFSKDPPPDRIETWSPAGPLATLEAQVRAWNTGDLDGYLRALHPQIRYQHGSLLLVGVEALHAHYQQRLTGKLSIQVTSMHQATQHAVVALDACLDGPAPWQGRALLTMVEEQGRWWVLADATTTVSLDRTLGNTPG